MYYIIVNPASKSGKGASIWNSLEQVLKEKEIAYKVFFSQAAGHVTKLVRDLSVSLLDSDPDFVLNLIILGGDGTLNEALQGISYFDRTQIGYIPTGSSNDLARDLKLSKDPLKALERILSCEKAVSMDLGCIVYEDYAEGEPAADRLARQFNQDMPKKKRFFAVGTGIGFDAAVCEESISSGFKKLLNKLGLGKLTYLTIALKQLALAKKVTCTITLDDGRILSMPRFLFVASMIHRFEGGGFKFCPDADSTDGLLDICAVGDIPKWLVLVALPTAFKGNHYRFKGIDHYLTSNLRIQTSIPLWVHTDGEVMMKSGSLSISCEKQKLQLLL